MGAKHEYGADRNFADGLDKNRAATPQLVHDVAVVDDFMVNVDRLAIQFERQVNDIHGPHHSGANDARPHSYQRLRASRRPLDLC